LQDRQTKAAGAELILWHTKDWEGLYPFYKASL